MISKLIDSVKLIKQFWAFHSHPDQL